MTNAGSETILNINNVYEKNNSNILESFTSNTDTNSDMGF